ncbi:MAG: alpha/beta fold hydrolase [Leptolinea sp.]
MSTVNPNIYNSEYDGRAFNLKGSEDSVLLFHGFTATTLEVRDLAEQIHQQARCTISAPLLPGHGTSPEDLSSRHFQEWLEAAEHSYTILQSRSRTVFVGGESMGGLLALYLAARHPEIIGIMLFAPALITPKLREAQILRWFIYGFPKKDLDDTKKGFLPWQGYRINPLKAVVELGKLQSFVRNLLTEIKQPTIIFQGKQDKTVDPMGSMIIHQTISSQNKQLVKLENCGHCVLLDPQRVQVYQLCMQFLNNLHTT